MKKNFRYILSNYNNGILFYKFMDIYEVSLCILLNQINVLIELLLYNAHFKLIHFHVKNMAIRQLYMPVYYSDYIGNKPIDILHT